MVNDSISGTRAALGSPVTKISPALTIKHSKANRPYIMGSAVVGTIPARDGFQTTALVGQASVVKGIMCLGIPPIYQRGGFVDKGYDALYNNMALSGAFWCALDLANFSASDISDEEGILSVDKNGVFSYSLTLPADNVEVKNAVVLNYSNTPLTNPVSRTIKVNDEIYEFDYPSGIGGILLVLKDSESEEPEPKTTLNLSKTSIQLAIGESSSVSADTNADSIDLTIDDESIVSGVIS